MNKVKIAKWFGFGAALLSGIGIILAGDLVQGVGIIAASLSSASMLKSE